MDRTQIARIVHETIRAHNAAHGDTSLPPWENAPDWQVAATLQAVDFHLANPNVPASATHEDWMAHKQADGWVFGKTKDAEAKTHPALVPFDALPPQEKAKDHIIAALVRTLST